MEIRGPACLDGSRSRYQRHGARERGVRKESDVTAVDHGCRSIECGRATVVAELAGGDERA
jgi:hypothetical protein